MNHGPDPFDAPSLASDVTKAPVPIERLARQLRSQRATLPPAGVDQATAGRGAGDLMHYDARVVAAATMLEVPIPERAVVAWDRHLRFSEFCYDPKTRALVEEALAPAGLDAREPQS